MFIMIDGIDGSGKSTVIQAWKDFLTKEGNAIFDLKNYWKEKNKYPQVSEIKSYDFVFSCEPTRVGIGQVIRDELIRGGNNYPASAIADAYSLDRLILYTKTLIPLLKKRRCIIQDRGISSTLAYQTIKDGVPFEDVAGLTGNKLALKYRPDHLVILSTDPETACKRLKIRSEKKDNAIFEKLEFMKKIATQFRSKRYQEIFNKCGTQIHYLSGEEKIDIMKEQAIGLLKNILNIKK